MTNGPLRIRYATGALLIALGLAGGCARPRHQLAYERQDPPGRNRLYVYDIDTGEEQEIDLDNQGLVSIVRWMDGGKKLLLQRQDDWEYYLFDAVSGRWGDCLSCDIAPGQEYEQMAFSPSGKMVARSSKQGLTITRLDDGKKKARLIVENSAISPLGWFPDGKSILCVDGRSHDICRVNVDGSGFVNLTAGLEKDQIFSLALSPRGDRLAFHRLLDGRVTLMIVNSDGSGLRRLVDVSPPSLTIQSSENILTTVHWSPDGQQLVFTALTPDRPPYDTDVSIIRADGSGWINLTEEHTGADWGAVWSPDGEWLAFVSDRSGNQDIWVMRSDGSDPVNESQTPKFGEYHPSWR